MWLLPILIVGTAVLLSIPMSWYLAGIIDGKFRGPRPLRWVERQLDTGPQNWKQYAFSLMLFNTVMFLFGYALLAFQPDLPLNQKDAVFPEGKSMLSPTTIVNTAISFLTNTNLQHYSGEQHLSYFSQLGFIVWNMFVSAAVGFGALAAVIRGLRGDPHMGNFYVDLWRVVVYVFVPFSLLTGFLLIASGIPMTLEPAAEVQTVQVGSMGFDTVDGKDVPKPQVIARGPVGAVLPIKHLGTNGGGFFGANSAHPYENPSAGTNFVECVSILFFPFSLVLMYGRMIGQMCQAIVIYAVMLAMFLSLIGWAVYHDTLKPNPGLLAQPARTVTVGPDTKETPALGALPVDQSGFGNLEGKELRFGPSAATGSPIVENGQVRGTSLIAQPFTADEYFWPRPSAAGYNGTASGASNWGANNPKLRDRVTQFIGPIVQYKKASRFYAGAEPAKAVQRDIEAWFAAKPDRLAEWEAEFETAAANWKQANAVPPSGAAIPALFFEMWLRDPANADRVADLEPVAADMVMASASGLDPHISLRNALSVYQLDRVAAKRSAAATIAALVRKLSFTPLGGLVGEPLVNVLELNLALDREFPMPAGSK